MPEPVVWLAHWIGRCVGFIVGSLLAVRRRHVLAAMGRAGISEPAKAANAMYAGLGAGLVELLATIFVRPRLDDFASKLPQGASVVATAHTGNWDLCACAVARQMPLAVVTKHLKLRWADRLWQWVRSRFGLQLLSVGRVASRASAALRDGRAVAMLIDQAPERTRATVVTHFLGAPARVDLSPALLAMRARVPLVVAFPTRGQDGAHALVVAARFEPPARPRRSWAEQVMRQATSALETEVRNHPEQWLWMHRRWKDAPGGSTLLTRPSAAPC